MTHSHLDYCHILLGCRSNLKTFIHWHGTDRSYRGFLGGSAGKESAWNVGDLCSIPELERSPGEGNGYPLLYSGLEYSMDCIVHGVAKSRHNWAIFTHSLMAQTLTNQKGSSHSDGPAPWSWSAIFYPLPNWSPCLQPSTCSNPSSALQLWWFSTASSGSCQLLDSSSFNSFPLHTL